MAEQYSLPDVLARMYENQLAIEAALMELVLLEEQRGSSDACENARGALEKIGENAGYIMQGIARLGEKRTLANENFSLKNGSAVQDPAPRSTRNAPPHYLQLCTQVHRPRPQLRARIPPTGLPY